MTIHTWKVSPDDDVVVVLADAAAGDTLLTQEGSFAAAQSIPQGHKAAVREIKARQMVKKYGAPIGCAKTDIHVGEHVHCHNLKDVTEELCGQYRENYLCREADGKC